MLQEIRLIVTCQPFLFFFLNLDIILLFFFTHHRIQAAEYSTKYKHFANLYIDRKGCEVLA